MVKLKIVDLRLHPITVDHSLVLLSLVYLLVLKHNCKLGLPGLKQQQKQKPNA